MVQQCSKSADRIGFLFSGATSVGATVSWLMANSGRLQTDKDRGVRESKDQVSFSSLSHIMSGGQWETPVEGGWGRRQPWVFSQHWRMCRHTHDRKARHKQTRHGVSHVGLEIHSYQTWHYWVYLETISSESDVKLHGTCLLTAAWSANTVCWPIVTEFTVCTVCYYVLTSADIARDLGVKVGEGGGGVDGWMDREMRGKRGVQAGTWVHRLLLINSLMGADRTCAAIK